MSTVESDQVDIRPVTPDDYLDISVLLTTAFRQGNEDSLVKKLRQENTVAVELVAADQGGLVGHVVVSHMVAPENWVALGPVCVRPQNEGGGIGGDLVVNALDRARRAGFEAAVVVGGPQYYKRFGFVFGGPVTFETPYPTEFTGYYWLRPGPVSIGQRVALVYPRAFREA